MVTQLEINAALQDFVSAQTEIKLTYFFDQCEKH